MSFHKELELRQDDPSGIAGPPINFYSFSVEERTSQPMVFFVDDSFDAALMRIHFLKCSRNTLYKNSKNLLKRDKFLALSLKVNICSRFNIYFIFIAMIRLYSMAIHACNCVKFITGNFNSNSLLRGIHYLMRRCTLNLYNS